MAEAFEIQNLARSVNEILILTAIGRGRKHGYQIALEIEERSGGFFTFNHGTLYPILHHLEKGGLIDGCWADTDGRRKRKEYTVTDAGRQYLRERALAWRTLCQRLAAIIAEDGGE